MAWILHCCGCGAGSCSSNWTPNLGTSICRWCGPKKQKKRGGVLGLIPEVLSSKEPSSFNRNSSRACRISYLFWKEREEWESGYFHLDQEKLGQGTPVSLEIKVFTHRVSFCPEPWPVCALPPGLSSLAQVLRPATPASCAPTSETSWMAWVKPDALICRYL